MIQVICIKWGTKYSDEYVYKLFRGISRNTSKSFLFTCFTNDKVPNVITRPIPKFTGDWHSKISLYNKELYNQEDQIFYFDLDTVIVGDLDEIFSYKGDYILLRDFYRKNGYGSGFMSWRPPAVDFMWRNYHGCKVRHGDQGWCEEQYPNADIWQEKYPEKIISYKVHIDGKGVLRNPNYTNYPGSLDTASVVCFHGRPNPHEIKREWLTKHWN